MRSLLLLQTVLRVLVWMTNLVLVLPCVCLSGVNCVYGVSLGLGWTTLAALAWLCVALNFLALVRLKVNQPRPWLVVLAVSGNLLLFTIVAFAYVHTVADGLSVEAGFLIVQALLGPMLTVAWLLVVHFVRLPPWYQCLKCGYDLRGNPAAEVCPECGGSISSDQQLALTASSPVSQPKVGHSVEKAFAWVVVVLVMLHLPWLVWLDIRRREVVATWKDMVFDYYQHGEPGLANHLELRDPDWVGEADFQRKVLVDHFTYWHVHPRHAQVIMRGPNRAALIPWPEPVLSFDLYGGMVVIFLRTSQGWKVEYVEWYDD